jgi:hypothetical protein
MSTPSRSAMRSATVPSRITSSGYCEITVFMSTENCAKRLRSSW